MRRVSAVSAAVRPTLRRRREHAVRSGSGGFMLTHRALAPMLAACAALSPLPPASAAPPSYELQWGSAGSLPGQFQFAHGIHADRATGVIYVGDSLNDRVQKFTADGLFLAA